jgi:hypothetical protein
MPIITTPHARVIKARKGLGPILRQRTVAGGWKRTYVTKKTSVMMFWEVAVSDIGHDGI